MIHYLQGAVVFIVGVVAAGLIGRAIGGPAAPLLSMVLAFPLGVAAVAVATRP